MGDLEATDPIGLFDSTVGGPVLVTLASHLATTAVSTLLVLLAAPLALDDLVGDMRDLVLALARVTGMVQCRCLIGVETEVGWFGIFWP